MRYNEAKEQRDQLKQAIINKTAELEQLKNEAVQIQEESNQLRASHDNELDKEKTEAYKKFADAAVAPIEAELSAAVNKVNKLTGLYQEQLAMITKEKVEAELGVDKHLSESVMASSEKLKGQIVSMVGEEFMGRISESMEQQSFQIKEKDLESYVQYFNQTAITLKKFELVSKIIPDGFLSRQVDKLSLDKSKLTGRQFGILVGAIAAVLLLTAKYTLPAYVMFCALLMTGNAVRSTLIQRSLRAHKAVLDNLSAIEERIARQVDAEMEKQQNELGQSYEKTKQMYEGKIGALKQKVGQAVSEASSSFQFTEDAGKLQIFEAQLQSLEDREAQRGKAEQAVGAELEGLKGKLAEAEKLLETAVGTLQREYLNGGGTEKSFLYNPNFLIDVADGKPAMHKHNRGNNLYLYEDTMEAVNFMSLIMYQLRCRISPFALNLIYYDTLYAGSYMQGFVDRGKALPFEICTDAEQVQESIGALLKKRDKRLGILRDVPDIEMHNKKMLEMDSVPEAYYFVFAQELDLQIQQRADFKSLTVTGGRVGIFLFNFVPLSFFRKEKENFLGQLDNYSEVYTISGGNVKRKAITFVKERL